MINYEKYKDEIDEIFDTNDGTIAINKNTNEITNCNDFECSKCLFSARYNNAIYCLITMAKWLVSEYKVDWSKVPVDTPVLISVDNKNWFNRYFAGVNEKGQPTVFCYGATQWSNGYKEPCHFKYIKLAEVE